MVTGITMIKVAPDQEKAVYEALREIDGVKEIYNLFGEFDFFLILEASDREGLKQLLYEIRDLRYVIDIWSLLVSKDKSLSEVEIAFPQVGELAIS